MAIPMRPAVPEFRRLVWGAAFLLCSTLAAGELHLHEAGVPDDCCTACSLAHAELAGAGVDAGADEPGPAPATAAQPPTIAVLARPFEAERSRAPPLTS